MLATLAAEAPSANSSSGIVLVAIVMGAFSVIGTAVGGWYTYRAARRNAEATREVEKDKISTSSWEAQVEAWRTDVVELRRQRAEDRAEYEERITECSEKIANQARKLSDVIDAHERDRAEHREQRLLLEKRIDALVRWGREVVVIMRDQGISFPPPPPGIAGDTNPHGFPAIREQ